MPYKPGGANKPQLYIGKGHGEESGQYAKEDKSKSKRQVVRIRPHKNIIGKYNPFGSKLVGKVTNTSYVTLGGDLPTKYKPNSVGKMIAFGKVIRERYYNDKAEVYLDIDYTCHGNPKQHPHVPHIHRWTKEGDRLIHGKGEKFQ